MAARPLATFIGFGEAGRALAVPGARAYDLKLDRTATAETKRAEIAAAGVTACDDAATALRKADVALCLVTADQALAAAETDAAHLPDGALWLDMNSVAPDTKRAAARAIKAAGGRYVDVAVMAPVIPARHAVSLLVAGPHAADALAALIALGFTKVSIAGDKVGDASAIKMIRSVMVKGIEALSAECALAAEAAGARDAVIASLDASWPGADWARRFDYNLDRMMVHGTRRAAEMEEVVKTLDALGTGSAMTRGTVERQRAIGAMGLEAPAGLQAKLSSLLVTPAQAGVSRGEGDAPSRKIPAFAGVTVGLAEATDRSSGLEQAAE